MKISYPATDTLRCVQTRCFGTAVFCFFALLFFGVSAGLFTQDRPQPLVAVFAALGAIAAAIALGCFERMRVDVERGDFLLFCHRVGLRRRMYVRLDSALIRAVRIEQVHEAYDTLWRSCLVRNDGGRDIELTPQADFDGYQAGLSVYRHLAMHGVLLECDAPRETPHLEREQDNARLAAERARERCA